MSNYISETLHFAMIVGLLICCVLLQAVSGYARSYPTSSYDQLLKDFAPLSTIVAGVSGYSLILDKGKVHGVNSGDLFEVYGKGIPVLDPDDGEIIGYIKKPLATIRVTQPENSKSICEVVTAQGPLSVGQPAMRYSDMAAAFVDRSDLGSAHEFRQDLEHAFPDLIWLDPSDVPSDVLDPQSMKTLGIVLLFALERDGLKVYGPDLVLLHKYPVFRAKGAERQKCSADIFEDVDDVEHWYDTGNRKFKTPLKSFDLDNAHLVGRLPESAIQVDILDLNGDNDPEIVYLLPSGLYVGHYGSQGELASYRFCGPGRLVGFSAVNTHGWIVLNVLLDGAGMRSMLLSYQDCTFSLIEDEINLWLAFADRDGDGLKESLLGQSFDVDVMFGPKVYLMEPGYEGLKYRHRIVSPKSFSVIRSSWSDLNGNGLPEVCIIDYGGKVFVYEMEQLLWSSSNRISPQLPEGGFPKWFVSADVDGNGLPELLFPGVPGEESTLAGDWLMLLGWEDGKYILKSMMQPVEASICGLVVVQDQLITGIARPTQKLDGKGESFLYSLGQFGVKNHPAE
ncbi:MAG: VCBS repeat-containing protein [Deltaproteobacteria bacterium]|nr:VCBS repeat-containing protein [Deltaproteobacteria bacterium]MBW1719279.1 VCBS repeat-containing protein [Deltaproteobacteria bacterium]MBW1964344.1 VCBS repeat-containing protein [Deltaproteobacteria bacterium]MBW2080169.1 VCBS repeat-containing protein [Deltaproteobacteria bacterium]